MTTLNEVRCDHCGQTMTLGKPKHKWLDKENDIALKYHQCKFCKAIFPERIQTNALLAEVRKMNAMRAKINQTGKQVKSDAAKDRLEDMVTEAEVFQLQILQEQERLRQKYGADLGFCQRQRPKCGLDVADLKVDKHLFGIDGDKEICRARLACVCGWVGRWLELKVVG